MGVPFQQVEAALDDASAELFADRSVRSLGIGRHGDQFGYFVVRHDARILPQAGMVSLGTSKAQKPLKAEIAGVPVTVRVAAHDLRVHLKLPMSGPGSPTAGSSVIEQHGRRPLCDGLQIQNFDNDVRSGVIAGGHIIIGTLGCFVTLIDGRAAILSNNHVVAGENHGRRGADRILQPGSGEFDAAGHVATLTRFQRIHPSVAGAQPANGNVKWNEIDAGVAAIENAIAFDQNFHPTRLGLPVISGVASARVGDRVFKVGRTTGLTRGIVQSVSTIVGPVPYTDGESWFRRSIVIEGLNGTMFSDHGDSGSAIVKETGEAIGLLYAGNGSQTYACPMNTVLSKLKCALN